MPQTVEVYRVERKATVRDQRSGRFFAATPAQQPVLQAHVKYDELEPGSRANKKCVGAIQAPLEEVRAESGTLHLDDCQLSVQRVRRLTLRMKSSDTFDRNARQRIGVQLGGSGYLQVSYRYRFLDGLFLDVGGLAVTAPVVNGSAGLVYELPLKPRWALYLGAGWGGGAVFGERDYCDPDEEPCAPEPESVTTSFLYGRLGVAYQIERNSFGVDVGVWQGALRGSRTIGPDREHGFTQPMFGLSWHHAP